MNRIKKATISTKKFIDDHKVAIAVTVTAVACLTLNRWELNGHDNFLKAKGLYDEYYALDEE